MSRLAIAAWDIPGRCDIRAMTYVLNAHLRRHDTYRNWFEHNGEQFVRRTIPEARDLPPIDAMFALLEEEGGQVGMLHHIMDQADVDDGTKEGLSSSERAELVRLRREVRVKDMEIEILKRASAFFARENVLPK